MQSQRELPGFRPLRDSPLGQSDNITMIIEFNTNRQCTPLNTTSLWVFGNYLQGLDRKSSRTDRRVESYRPSPTDFHRKRCVSYQPSISCRNVWWCTHRPHFPRRRKLWTPENILCQTLVLPLSTCEPRQKLFEITVKGKLRLTNSDPTFSWLQRMTFLVHYAASVDSKWTVCPESTWIGDPAWSPIKPVRHNAQAVTDSGCNCRRSLPLPNFRENHSRPISG